MGVYMSSSDSNCIEECCQDCFQSMCDSCIENCTTRCEESCQNCTQSCTDSCSNSCSDSCSQSCGQSCSNSCNNSCSSSCSSSSCCSSSSSLKMIAPFFPLTICELLIVAFIGLLQSFNPLGPIFLTIFGSVFLSISLSGINTTDHSRKRLCSLGKNNGNLITSTHFGKIVINHSHHPLHLIQSGHEFQIGSRSFCTGCYGILIGTIISIFFSIFYVVFQVPSQISSLCLFLVPICILPILIRYFIVKNASTPFRLVSNALLPIGCCFLLISIDSLFHEWIVNELVVLLIIFAALLRSYLAKKDNK